MTAHGSDQVLGDGDRTPGADPLAQFFAPVAAWFREVFVEPTIVQSQAWEAISRGEHALVVAPTGSGKTLAAFLWALSQLTSRGLMREPGVEPRLDSAGGTDGGTRILYISPLKALGVDVERNLRVPLAGIARTAAAAEMDIAPVSVGVRSGDTPQNERAKLLRTPPDVLITTPESLYLMLTSKAAGTLAHVDTVILDEVHAVAGTKRGAHLALSLERLEEVTGRSVQRIGLSATVNPVQTVASFLGGDRPVTVVNPPTRKLWDVQVRSVVPDFRDPPEIDLTVAIGGEETATDIPLDDALAGPSLVGEVVERESTLPQKKSVWPHLQRAIYDQIMANRSTLVFVNSRRSAERLTGALNELWAQEHDPDSLAAPTRRDPAQVMAQSDAVIGAPAVIARAHHGSVSKDERADIETALKEGSLRCVVATSSLELGIDMGLVDHVVQVGAPPSVSSAVQRAGRAGHSVGAVSHATVYPLHRQDAEASAVIVDRMLAGDLEPLHVVTNALDVLAQQTVARAVQATQPRAARSEKLGDGSGTSISGEAIEASETVGNATLNVEEWFRTVRRAHPYAALPREAFDGVIELISGRYPSTDFADLRPRVIYDAASGELEARPGAQRIAVTSGGTIPNRGLFGVFLPADASGSGGRRVGELDEEMVYESRVGDIFTLGASSWRISEINRDQVIVTPAAGHTGRLPFWIGDAEGRPAALGPVIGAARRAWGTGNTKDLREASFLDANTRANLDAFYSGQRDATKIIPDEQTILVERFHDEVGDWRVVVHSPWGRSVNAPWALAIGAALNNQSGIDAMAVAGDDGIVLRLPYIEEPPGMELLTGAAGSDARDAAHLAADVAAEVTHAVGSSALFAGRFRECAARALLLPQRNPGKRQPLWQQRQRAAQLLDVARPHPEFPVMVETMRECLQDVYNLPALEEVIGGIGARRLRIAEITSEVPSPFSESLLFSYTGAFLYDRDSAERAAALSVDPALLAAVLGARGKGIELDPEAIADIVAGLQWLADGRRARSAEQVVDMLRVLGPLAPQEVARRVEPDVLDGGALVGADAVMASVQHMIPRRVCEVKVGGVLSWAVVEDIPLLRDGLGIPVPLGVAAPPETISDALDQLLLRWTRTHGPFTAVEVSTEFGLGVATADALLKRWVAGSRLVAVDAVDSADSGNSVESSENLRTYVDSGVLRRLRAATMARARGSVEPVSQQTYAAFLADWHGLGDSTREDLLTVLEQLAGVALPASAWENMVLPARIPNYTPTDLDDLVTSGEILVVGAGVVTPIDPLIMLLPADLAPLLVNVNSHGNTRGQASGKEGGSSAKIPLGPVAQLVLERIASGGAFLAAEIERMLGEDSSMDAPTHGAIDEAMRELFDAGMLMPDSFAAIRARLAGTGITGTTSTRGAHKAPRMNRGRGSSARLRMGRTTFAQSARSEEVRTRRAAMNAHAGVPGRWSLVPAPGEDAGERALARSEAWLDRYAVVTRGSITAEHAEGGFAAAYRMLTAWEDNGTVLRGYIIDGLGGAQFAPREVIDQLRHLEEKPATPAEGEHSPIVLAAADPANPHGAAIPWPELPADRARPTRGAGALVVIHQGRLLAHFTRGGRTAMIFPPPSLVDGTEAPDASEVHTVVSALSHLVQEGRLSPVVVEKINGVDVMRASTTSWTDAGARLTPKGLVVR